MPESTTATPAAGSWRELAQVGWPLVVSSGSLALMYVVDRFFLMRYSPDALAGAGPAGLLHWTLISLAFGTAVYVNTFVAQYDGAGRKERVAAALWQGVWFSLAAGALLLPLVPLAPRLFALVDHDPAVQAQEMAYFVPLCYGTVPILLAATLACFYSGRGRTRAVMWVNLASALTNALLDWLLIFGWGPIPAWGAAGAAIATSLANVLAAALYVALMWRDSEGFPLRSQWRLDPELFRRLLKFGLPSGFHLLVDGLCFTLFILLVGRLGKAELAATNLAFTLNMLAFVPILGLGTALMTLTGQRIGDGRPALAAKSTWRALLVAELFTVCCAAVYLLWPGLILAGFSGDLDPTELAELHDEVVILLRFVAVYAVFDCMTVIFGATVRGAGDTRFTLWFAALTGFFLMVLPTWLAQRYWNGGLKAGWSAATALIVVLGIGFMLRFLGGKWQRMRVIETTLDPASGPEEAEETSSVLTPAPAAVE